MKNIVRSIKAKIRANDAGDELVSAKSSIAAPTEPSEPPAIGDKNTENGVLFAELTIYPPRGGLGPSANACLAHLKLLHALHAMKEDVGYADGLWNIWNTRADDQREKLFEQTSSPPITAEDKKRASLSRIREKRWALFVARAVDRYEAWWDTFPKKMLTEEHMTQRTSLYNKFTTRGKYLPWEKRMMPPLGTRHFYHTLKAVLTDVELRCSNGIALSPLKPAFFP